MLREVKENALILRNADGCELLRIEESVGSSSVRLLVFGDVTPESAGEFEDELLAAALGCAEVTVHLDGTQFLCAGALRAMLAARQILAQRGGAVRVLGANESIRQKMRDTGLEKLLGGAQEL